MDGGAREDKRRVIARGGIFSRSFSAARAIASLRQSHGAILMNALDAVLDHIDRDLDQSLGRLFDFLRIQSVSTDPAYKDYCRAAAEYVAKNLSDLGLESSIRPTGGHPIVLGKTPQGQGNGKGPRVLFYGHYDVQPVDPLDLWETPPFEPRFATLPDGRKIIAGRGSCDDKGRAMTCI